MRDEIGFEKDSAGERVAVRFEPFDYESVFETIDGECSSDPNSGRTPAQIADKLLRLIVLSKGASKEEEIEKNLSRQMMHPLAIGVRATSLGLLLGFESGCTLEELADGTGLDRAAYNKQVIRFSELLGYKTPAMRSLEARGVYSERQSIVHERHIEQSKRASQCKGQSLNAVAGKYRAAGQQTRNNCLTAVREGH